MAKGKGKIIDDAAVSPVKFDHYKLEIELIEKLLGTCPKNPEVYKAYIMTKAPSEDLYPEEAKDAEESFKELEEKNWTGFMFDENGLFIYDYLIKGNLKENANTLKDMLGIAALRSKVEESVFVYPRRIYFGTKEPHGYIERPLRAMTAQGPRVTVTRSDYINEGTTITCYLEVLHGYMPKKILTAILDFGSRKGLGQFRTGGYGRYVYKLNDISHEEFDDAVALLENVV